MTKSIHPERDSMPYRACVGIVVFNRNGKVFAGRRKPKSHEQVEQAWQLPQGGIDAGEEPLNAAIRELFEETSIQAVSLLAAAPDWIYYDLPDQALGVSLKGKYRGQKQKWFAYLYEGDESEIDVEHPGGGAHPSEFDAWRWEDLSTLPDLIVPFKRAAYEQVVAAFADIPQKLADTAGPQK